MLKKARETHSLYRILLGHTCNPAVSRTSHTAHLPWLSETPIPTSIPLHCARHWQRHNLLPHNAYHQRQTINRQTITRQTVNRQTVNRQPAS